MRYGCRGGWLAERIPMDRPDQGSEVRTRLPAGGSRIRTLGSALGTHRLGTAFCRLRDPSPAFPPPKRKHPFPTGDRVSLASPLNLSAETTALLIIKANRVLARRTVIPLEADANKEQRLRKFREAKTAMPAGSHYLEAQQRVHGRLVAGVRTKARRASGGRYKSVDPVEYTGAELQGSDAIDKRTRTATTPACPIPSLGPAVEGAAVPRPATSVSTLAVPARGGPNPERDREFASQIDSMPGGNAIRLNTGIRGFRSSFWLP
jgi:hypothetical protein